MFALQLHHLLLLLELTVANRAQILLPIALPPILNPLQPPDLLLGEPDLVVGVASSHEVEEVEEVEEGVVLHVLVEQRGGSALGNLHTVIVGVVEDDSAMIAASSVGFNDYCVILSFRLFENRFSGASSVVTSPWVHKVRKIFKIVLVFLFVLLDKPRFLVDVTIVRTLRTHLLVVSHQTSRKVGVAKGTLFSSMFALVGMRVQLEEGLLIPAESARDALLFWLTVAEYLLAGTFSQETWSWTHLTFGLVGSQC